MRVIGEIPAREGSQRVPRKNLRLLDGKPLISYAIEAARQAQTLQEVYVNSESDAIGELAVRYGARFYKRPSTLATSTARQDEFNYDFIKAVNADVLVMVNPVSPLIESGDIDQMVRHFLDQPLDTLIASREESVHTLYQGQPVNFDPRAKLARTQDLPPIQLCAWSVCIWRAKTFMEQYEQHGHAAFSGRVGFYPLNQFKTVKISTEEDFILAEVLVRNMHRWKFPAVPYDSLQLDPDYPVMWLSEIKAIERVLDEQAQDGKFLNILEWGAGRSTIYFSNFLRRRGAQFHWLAVENHIPWHQEVLRMIEANQLAETVTCVLKNGTCEERKYIQETFDMTEYLTYPTTCGRLFDVIIVDGRRRRECLEMASRLLTPTGVAVLHDAERPDYHRAFASFADGGRFVCENKSPVPGGVQRLWVGSPLRAAVGVGQGTTDGGTK
ncbi:MAG: hypothetical protein A3D28_01695 [Omnitrophica bacterium RIFCSPHIGHO2_02_FULL_63_14]|nr:MAG: hypothetical protein A3D28_01695 [Omnitrophica bacterium RIFCSPHIGHO2_02_FULL_63_14]